jgi:histidinol dehydrogenase
MSKPGPEIRQIRLDEPSGREAVEQILARLRVNVTQLFADGGEQVEIESQVRGTLRSVCERGDDALVELARKFDDPDFSRDKLRVSAGAMDGALEATPQPLREALERSVEQVRAYQESIRPSNASFRREGVEIQTRYTPLQSAGLYVPGGKAAYPSTVVMLGVPAIVAGVERIVVASPPRKGGGADLMLAACRILGIREVYRVGGAGAVAAMAFGTSSIKPVDKIFGPGNLFVQAAKRMVIGAVGVDGFLGPSEILVLADESADAELIAADMLAQAEHDPGSCFLLTSSQGLADAVAAQINVQVASLPRKEAVIRSLERFSTVIVSRDWETLIDQANRLACEHVSVQTRDPQAVVSGLRNAGAVYVGPFSAVALGDYVAGPSHCLPTGTTARFTSGVAVTDFLRRAAVVRYDAQGAAADGAPAAELARGEGLEAHARSIDRRALHGA